MVTAYFDCFCGAAGDMIVASLLDAGLDEAVLRAALNGLNLDGYEIEIGRTARRGIAACRFDVRLTEDAQPHRHLGDILGILDRGGLSASVRERAGRVFQRLAEAEARVHGCGVEQVHFHEVGAVDAIIDIVGGVFGLEALGVDRVVCSPIPVGSGTVTCAHGEMPVPAPATAALLTGVPIAECPVTGELTTPTGAAVLTTLARGYGPMPAMTIRSTGYGAGLHDRPGRANVLRVVLGEAPETDATGVAGVVDEVSVLETQLDDETPEVLAYCAERLLAAGALDVFVVPIQMKKGRAGVLLTVICEPAEAARLEGVIFAETPTFGIRSRTQRRTTLTRRFERVDTPFGPVRVKVGTIGERQTRSPEYEDCRRLAQSRGVPLRDVLEAVRCAIGAR